MATIKYKTDDGFVSIPSTIATKTNAEQGFGYGVCTTDTSVNEKEVYLPGYELVTNGFVSVSFTNDVSGGAFLNVNSKGSKPIYNKGAVLESDVIKADNTVMFCYDGTNYVVTSLGGGGEAIAFEALFIALTQINGNNEDLIGATITITDDDTGQIINSGTWNGTRLNFVILHRTNYTISVETITGYLSCANQSYLAAAGNTRNVSFQYRASGAFVEATDGTLYKASTWASSGKTANAVVVLTDACKVRMALTEISLPYHTNDFDPLENYLTEKDEASAKVDYDGEGNTDKIIQFNIAYGTNTTDYVAPYCKAFSFTYPSGQKGCLPSFGQLWTLYQNKTEVDACLAACGGTAMYTYMIRSSTYWGIRSHDNRRIVWMVNWSDGSLGHDFISYGGYHERIVSAYE